MQAKERDNHKSRTAPGFENPDCGSMQGSDASRRGLTRRFRLRRQLRKLMVRFDPIFTHPLPCGLRTGLEPFENPDSVKRHHLFAPPSARAKLRNNECSTGTKPARTASIPGNIPYTTCVNGEYPTLLISSELPLERNRMQGANVLYRVRLSV